MRKTLKTGPNNIDLYKLFIKKSHALIHEIHGYFRVIYTAKEGDRVPLNNLAMRI